MILAEIDAVLGMALSKVSRWFRRIGLGKTWTSVKGAGHRVTGDHRGQVKATVDGT
jgi:hypothetical protein